MFSGLRLTLHRAFYPDFDFASAFNKLNGEIQIATPSHSNPQKQKMRKFVPVWVFKKKVESAAAAASSSVSSSSQLSNASRSSSETESNAGVVLDNEVDELISLIKTGSTLSDIARACEGVITTNTNAERLKGKVANWSKATKALIRFLQKNAFIPERSQLVVGCTQIGVATKADLVCVHFKSKSYVLIENKVGYDYEECGKDVKMSPPFEKFDARVSHQNLLQLLGTQLLFERTFPSIDPRNIKSVLVRYKNSTDSVEDTHLPDDFLSLKADMWKALKR